MHSFEAIIFIFILNIKMQDLLLKENNLMFLVLQRLIICEFFHFIFQTMTMRIKPNKIFGIL